ncbi:hypothetical protein G9A89_021101 [Geosiphon pyriformis]|nr:hypothetical protein G9A89_021101 [Geosiphon pyriformis]
MSNTMTLIGARQGVQKLVLVLQNDAKSEFDEKVILLFMDVTFQAKKVQEEVENMNADEMEEFVHKRFEALNTLFLEKSKKIEEYVISKKPTKPVKTPNETEEEYERKREEYQNVQRFYFLEYSFDRPTYELVERTIR